MPRQAKVWFAHKSTYGYVNLNKTTKSMLIECDELSGVYYCYLQSIEDKLYKYVKKFVAYGEIDDKDRW